MPIVRLGIPIVSTMLLAASTGLAQVVSQAAPGGGPPTTRQEARPWHVRMLTSAHQLPTDSLLRLLEEKHLSEKMMAGTTREERLALVRRIQAAGAAAMTIRVAEDQRGVHIRLNAGGSGMEVLFTIEPTPPFGITTLELHPLAGSADAGAALIRWEEAEAGIREAEAAGLSGQVLLMRNGQEFLRAAFGYSDRSANRRTTPNTIYSIGSTPMDFTATAIRMLAEAGKLNLDSPITEWFDDVPSDRATLTPRMILEAKSGLAQFHGRPVDWDNDIAWIDRETAVRRILTAPLLSAPGSERRPSHSAFGLLAAIIEIASGERYIDFLRKQIFEPLGMNRTGLHGETFGLTADSFAVGYGHSAHGLPNIPPNWGPTSWLIMGSGGMVSTLDDMHRFYEALENGLLIRSNAENGPRSDRGVSDAGFSFMRSTNGRGDEVIFMTNTIRHEALNPLLGGLSRLVMSSSPPLSEPGSPTSDHEVRR